MNARPSAAILWSSLFLALGLSQCVTEPPYLPPGAGTGISLDTAPGRRNRQETRYLENTTPPPLPSPEMAGSYGGGTQVYETPEDIDTTPPTVEQTPKREPDPASIPPEPEKKVPVPAAPEQMPFGLPVPGKKGFVYSPFDKTQMVDVSGIPSGKKVRCPYTSKIFLVP